jgi:geranylgeranyl pyrophosphate synthase
VEFSTHIKSDEVEIERRIREFLLGSDPIVIRYLDAITGNTGKRLRPKLVMVFARLFGEYDYGKSITCACAAELLHTATLIHDDVIDTAQFRRGSETLCNAFGNEIAVIVGDYLLAIVLDRVAKVRDFEVLDMFVGTSKKLGVGVLVEVNNRNNFKLAVDNYLSVIELKTAVLFEHCTRLGAYLGGADAEGRRLAGEYGRDFGMAFQIVDDLLDIAADPKKTGKPSFNDLKEGRITLPLIHAIGKDPSIETLMNGWQERPSAESADALKARLRELGSMDYSRKKAEEYLAKAREKSAMLVPRWQSESARSDLEVIESGLFALLEEAGQNNTEMPQNPG